MCQKPRGDRIDWSLEGIQMLCHVGAILIPELLTAADKQPSKSGKIVGFFEDEE